MVTAWDKKTEELASFPALTQIFLQDFEQVIKAGTAGWTESWPEFSTHKICQGKK